MDRRLGGRTGSGSRLIYLTGIPRDTYWWKVKADTLHPIIYAGIVALLLGYASRFRSSDRVGSVSPFKPRVSQYADNRLSWSLPEIDDKVRQRLAAFREQGAVRRIWDRIPRSGRVPMRIGGSDG